MANSEIADALELETNYFSRTIRDRADHANAEIQALQRDFAAKGIAQSGARHIRELEIRLGTVAAAVDCAILKRKELGRKIPDLFTSARLNDLKNLLEQRIDSAVHALKNRELDRVVPGISAALNRRADSISGSLRARMIQELEALRLEARLGLHREEMPVTFNISHSTVASLNLGTVLGDLTVSMQNLNSQGQGDMAEAIRGLAEAIGASTELRDSQRKELFEHLSVVSEETGRPEEKRKMGPLKSSVLFLQNSLTVTAQLATLWAPIEKLLKAAGLMN